MIRCRECGSKTIRLSGYVRTGICDLVHAEGELELDIDTEASPFEIVYTDIECDECGSDDIEGLDELKRFVESQIDYPVTWEV